MRRTDSVARTPRTFVLGGAAAVAVAAPLPPFLLLDFRAAASISVGLIPSPFSLSSPLYFFSRPPLPPAEAVPPPLRSTGSAAEEERQRQQCAATAVRPSSVRNAFSLSPPKSLLSHPLQSSSCVRLAWKGPKKRRRRIASPPLSLLLRPLSSSYSDFLSPPPLSPFLPPDFSPPKKSSRERKGERGESFPLYFRRVVIVGPRGGEGGRPVLIGLWAALGL